MRLQAHKQLYATQATANSIPECFDSSTGSQITWQTETSVCMLMHAETLAKFSEEKNQTDV